VGGCVCVGNFVRMIESERASNSLRSFYSSVLPTILPPSLLNYF